MRVRKGKTVKGWCLSELCRRSVREETALILLIMKTKWWEKSVKPQDQQQGRPQLLAVGIMKDEND